MVKSETHVGNNYAGNNLFIFGNCLYVAWISLIFHLGGIFLFGLVVTKGTRYDGKFDGGSSYGGFTRESLISGGGGAGSGSGGKIVNVESGYRERGMRSLDKTQYI